MKSAAIDGNIEGIKLLKCVYAAFLCMVSRCADDTKKCVVGHPSALYKHLRSV